MPRPPHPRRRPARRDCLIVAALAVAVALIQRPGTATSDTKIDLHTDPVGFLADVAAVWSPTGDLGHVHSGQYSGYMFPMGPVFALGDLLGLAPWLVHRLWLAAVFVLAVTGAIRLADALLPNGGSAARLTAAAFYLLNPYVVVFANRTSVTLLAYALLPWMLLAVHRGLRDPRGWWWPAAGALIVASAGGGVNAAVLAWLLLAPAALLLYEPAIGAVTWRDARAFALRAAACLAPASLWWLAPLAAHVLYGRDFLPFTEQPGVIWGTTSASEALRLMGYWTSYIGVGYGGALRPFTSDAGVMLFHPAVVVASLLVPALVAAGLLAARRWAYAPFFVVLLLGGALIVMAGFPDGTPLRRAALAVYFNVPSTQALRTTYKAAPLIVIAFALLAAAAAPAVWASRRRIPAAIAAVAVLALASWPVVRGQAIDSRLSWEEIPGAWNDAAADLDRELPPNTRAVVLPAQLFGVYDWGSTVDPILPALTDRPVAARSALAYGDRRSVDLLWAVDGLVQQERVIEGQLPPLLALLGAGAVVTGSDDDRAYSGAIVPHGAAAQLAGLGPPDRTYGPERTVPPEAGTLGVRRRVAQVARRDLAPGPGIVRVLPSAPGTLVDGSAETLTGMAALGALDPGRPLAYAADRTAEEIRGAAEEGADLVIGDGNRRRVIVSSRARQEVGPTLAAAEEIPPDGAVLDPVQAGADAQTVAVYDGIRGVREQSLPGATQFPEQRPFAALDGSPATSWIAPPHGDLERHWMEVELLEPSDVPYVELLPHEDALARTTQVEIGGRTFDLRAGWNRLALGLRDVRTLRVRLSRVDRAPGVERAAGGIAELQIPGVSAREWLRPPRVLERALRGAALERASLTYLFQRTTGATPFRRNVAVGDPQARLVRDRGDAERQIARRIAPPVERTYEADGWATVSPTAADPELDRLAGTIGGEFASSGRYEGKPGRRASRAFDGDPQSAWIAPWRRGRGAWLSWTTPRTVTLEEIRLAPAGRVRHATTVTLTSEQGATTAEVDAADRVLLPVPVRGREFKLEITGAEFSSELSGRDRQNRAVGIAEVIAGGGRARDGEGGLAAPCGVLRVAAGDATLRLRSTGTVADLEAGRPLHVQSCGPPAELPAEEIDVTTSSEILSPYWLRLRSPAAQPPTVAGGGRVVDPGSAGRAEIDGVGLDLDGPSRLVLAQGYDRGWRAWCDGRPLGAPEPEAAYGNGWTVGAGCREARFAYAPDRLIRYAMLGSGAACVLILILLVVRRRPPTPTAAVRGFEPAHPARASWPKAATVGLAAGLAGAALIALRAGPVVAVAVALVARHGVGARPLILGAAGLLGVAVPLAYLLFLPDDRGGYAPRYAGDLVGAHWLASAALVLLALALWRIVSGPRERPRERATPGRAAAVPDRERAA